LPYWLRYIKRYSSGIRSSEAHRLPHTGTG
jgi:hypothetical protein